MAQFSLSPSIETREWDLTGTVPSVATSIGGYAGTFEWGPVKKIVTVSNEDELKNVFGGPKTSNATDWYCARNFLAYSTNLKNVRVVNEATAKNAVAADTAALIKNYDDFLDKSLTLTANKVVAKYPGPKGDSLKVSIADKESFLIWEYRSQYSTATKAITSTKTFTLGAGVTADVTIDSMLLTNVSNVATFKVGMTITGTGIADDSLVVAIVNESTIELSKAATASGTAIELTGTLSSIITTFPGQPTTSQYIENLGGSDDEVHIIVIDEDGLFSGTKGTVLEKFTKLSKAIDAKKADGSSNYYKEVINRSSQYIYITDAVAPDWDDTAETEFSSLAAPVKYSLTGGVDSHSSVTSADRIQGFAEFRDQENVDVSLIIGGEVTEEIADYLNDNIGAYRRDCVVFISPPKDAVVDTLTPTDNIIDFRNKLNNSTYAVMDTGWKYQYDAYNDQYVWVPLNADLAGLCAYVDAIRAPWWSPAGFNRGYVKDVIKLAYNPTSKAERDMLYQLGINSVVSFSGDGTVLYGDRTMTTQTSAFQNIGIRRMFIMVEKAIAAYSKFTLFEFNDSVTRARFIATVTPYLRDIQGRRGIQEFAVRADETVNTPEVIDSFGFVGDILIKPTYSVNFIRLNFAAIKTGASFEEVELF